MTEAKLFRLNPCHLQMTLSCWEDSYVLQRFLVVISKWCAENKLQLNLLKCMMMFFHHSEACFLVNLNVHGIRLWHVRGSGCLLQLTTYSWSVYWSHLTGTRKLLWLLSRAARSGSSILSLTVLYKTLIRPSLEYASVVWKLYYLQYLHYIIRLERIEGRFVRLVGMKLSNTLR